MKENESLRAIFIEVFKREQDGNEEDFYASNFYIYYFNDLEKLLKGLVLNKELEVQENLHPFGCRFL